MDWISEVVRTSSGELRVVTPYGSGSSEPRALSEVDSGFWVEKVVRRRTEISLGNLRRGDAEDYLSVFGINPLNKQKQSVYSTGSSIGELIIPAQLIIVQLLAPTLAAQQLLLSPHGACSLTASKVSESETDVSALRVEWLTTFPSAMQSWASVYRHALNGSFDMDMPAADVEVSIFGRFVHQKLYVTRIRIYTLRPNESPHPFANGVCRSWFAFRKHTQSTQSQRGFRVAAKDESVFIPPGDGKLSDAQWLSIETIVFRQYPPSRRSAGKRKVSLRTLIDIARLKTGTPYAWDDLPVDAHHAKSARNLLSVLRRTGAWQNINAVVSLAPALIDGDENTAVSTSNDS